MVEDFLRMLLHLLAAVKPKCKLHLSIERNVMIGHARHVPSLRSSSCGGILGYAAMRWSFTLDLGMSVSLSFDSCKAFLMLRWGMLH